MSLHNPTPDAAPSLQTTGLGYEYFRDRARGDDETAYLHHLLACVDHDPHEVFSDRYTVQRHCLIPWLNTPENIYLAPAWENGSAVR